MDKKKMKFELYLIAVVGLLVVGILYLIYLNPDDVIYYNSLQKIQFEKYGDYHFELVDGSEGHWATISSIKLIDNDTIEVNFNDNDYKINTKEGVVIYAVPKFEYTTTVTKGKTFISTCHGESAPSFLNYMGIVQIEGKYYYQFYHNSGVLLPDGMTCKFPEIIKHSLDANLDLSGYFVPIPPVQTSGKYYKNPDVIVDVPYPCDVLECENAN
ncbi:MAG TPA: hypothetical protein VGA92_05560 [Candidatus Nitrosotenuis sp.]|jgi:hypothetical protein